jgi:hypothetical protein
MGGASRDDSGKRLRLDLLRREADAKIIDHLRTHGWTASIEREVENGEYLIILAARGDAVHRIALLYTSATDNAVYKSAALEVEHIFFNGEPYMVESFAHGLDKPVGPVNSFHALLLQWNAKSAVGKFAPEDREVDIVHTTRRDMRMLLSEAPVEAIWLRLRQLQSVTLAQRMIRERAGRDNIELDAVTIRSKAEGVAYALRNASDYYRTRDIASVSQKVLNLYYGSLAFAFAEILASPTGISTLTGLENSTKQGHGLYTVDG